MANEVPIPPEPPSFVHNLFVGKEGIRAGWSIAIFVILSVILFYAFVFPAQLLIKGMHLPMNGSLPFPTGLMELAVFAAIFGASFIMTRIEHKPAISYGLDGPRRFVNFLYGLLFGFIALSALVGAMMLFGVLGFDGVQISGWTAIRYALAWGAVFLLVGLTEEYMLRGYLLATLSRGIGFWWSAIILSLAFGSLHLSNHGESPVGIFSAAAIGFIFCISLWYLKSLWWAIGFHAAWDWAESYFWGTADSGLSMKGHLLGTHPQGSALWSGGSTGPEGSMMIVFLLVIIAALMVVVWRNQRVNTAEAGRV